MKKLILSNNSRYLSLLFLTMFLTIVLATSASAITGKIGNGRMLINLEKGDSIERSILVINDNTVAVNISLLASGDLEKSITIIDKNFMLQPGEEKKAMFNLSADDVGKKEGKINVKFQPIGLNESGVGLSSQIILTVYEQGQLPDDSNVRTEDNQLNNTGNVSDFFGSIGSKVVGNKMALFLIVITVILIIAVVVLLRISKKKNGEKGGEFNSKLKYDVGKK
ncbi:MAG: hypothetical protein WC796_05475 [Candidatus Pacearchaeota archaeon]|jgi:hypothetical protein